MKNEEKYITAKDRIEAFTRHCLSVDCRKCSINKEICAAGFDQSKITCFAFWLYEGVKPDETLSCPFCGSKTECRKEWNGKYRVVCTANDCWYSSKIYDDKCDAVKCHNAVVKSHLKELGFTV